MTTITKKDLIDALKEVPDDAIMGIVLDHGEERRKTYVASEVLYRKRILEGDSINGKKMPECFFIYTHVDTDCMKF